MNKTPIRVLEGNAQPYQPFWRVVDAAESESGEAEIELYGAISEYAWWGDEVTPAKFKADLYSAGKGGPVTVRINSGGGEVYAASVMRAMLMDYPGRVTTRIDGLCASAATYVAMAGDVVMMQDSAFFMIHDPSTIAWGTLDELKTVVELLKTIKDGIIETYQSKTKLSYEKLSKLMSDETWLTAKEAKEMGFIDQVITQSKKKLETNLVGNAAILNMVGMYRNVPETLLHLLREPEREEESKENQQAERPDVTRLRAEIKVLS